MRNHATKLNIRAAVVLTVIGATTALFGAAGANAEATDFSNPAVAMTNAAVIASGTCIAKYAAQLDDHARTAPEIGREVAKHCAKELSRSAGLASWMVGKPDDFAKTLKYQTEDLTTNAVLRTRASSTKSHKV